jgi:PAS domain S-box-containing protein
MALTLNTGSSGGKAPMQQPDRYAPQRRRDPGERDSAAGELRRTLEHLSLVLSATGVGVWERDIAANSVTWSDTMHRLFGLGREQFSGSPDEVLGCVHPDDRAAFRAGYEAAVRGDGDAFTQEFRIVRGDGEVRWVYRRGQVRRGPDGVAHSVFGVALDVTERKQAEETNARLAAIASAADDAIIGLAPDGTILAWNPAAERMFGYAGDEAIGRSVRILYPADAGAEFEDVYRRVRAGEHVRHEGLRVRKDGAAVNVALAATPVRNKEGRVVGVAAVVRDIGEHKQMEHKLVEALAQLLRANSKSKLALLAGRMGTFEVELARQAVSWSDEIYAQVGIDRSTSIAAIQDVEPFIHADDRAAVRARREQAFETGETYEDEFRVVRADGEVRWLYVRAQPLPAENPTHAYGVSMDITERKEREERIRFLMSEVLHRSKNLLAVVQAIASQTVRSTSSPIAFAEDFGARLKSLASSLDLLVRRDWRGVSVRDLVQSQLGHYSDPHGARVALGGPDLLLSPAAAQNLGMALHELSTNAVKHGAFAVPRGRVRIEWKLMGPRRQRRFRMSWVESGGAPVEPPHTKGFGHLVIERMAAEALQGQVTLEFARDGVRWAIETDAETVVRGAGG